jgi:hypothetical protein
MATFTGTATAADSTVAEDLATEEARSQAFATYGANTEFVSFPSIYVKLNDNGTYTATYTTQAVYSLVPPPVSADVQESVFDPGTTFNAGDENVFNPRPEPVESVFDPGTTFNAGDENVFNPRPEPVESVFDPGLPQPSADFFANPDADAERAAAGAVSALRANAQLQNTLQNRVSLPASADWRVRLSLAQNANYLYRDPSVMLLQPLARTNGVVFPYTPNIDMNYAAKYDSVDLTHSNYRGHFYRSSSVDSISIRGTFTAQDTREAQYLLAVITFFKSVTKMFYGATDPLAGTPPPLVFLSGLGQFQFNNHPCVVSNFQYNLPGEVDYIRANGFNNYGLNMDNRRNQSSGPPASGLQGAIATVNRLLNNKLVQGALGKTGSTQSNNSAVSQNNSNTNYTNSTYVPTKMEINLTLLPIQTRSQISTQFDLKKFAAGDLLQQGFW